MDAKHVMAKTVRLAAMLGLIGYGASAAAHDLGEPKPFHVSPGDFFVIPVTGGTFAGVAGLTVRFTPTAGGSSVDQAPESVVPNTSVGVRVPAGLSGQYDLSLLISGTPSGGTTRSVWVRSRQFTFIGKPVAYLPGQPTDGAADFKDVDFSDLDNDGFLDVFSTNSTPSFGSGLSLDRLFINQKGRAIAGTPPDCPTEFCNMTTNVTNPVSYSGERTYDASLADIDRDGDVDIVRSDASGTAPIQVMVNDGNGHFVDTPALLPPVGEVNTILETGWPCQVHVRDVDGDGQPDILACPWYHGQNLLFLNRLGTIGRFQLVNETPCNPASAGASGLCKARDYNNRGCALGDFNGDSRVDIILPDMDAGTPGHPGDVVLINDGNVAGVPQFSVHEGWVKAADGTSPQTALAGGQVNVVDLDGDTDDDVVVAGGFGSDGRILWNDNNTKLVQLDGTHYASSVKSYDVAFADLDRDGDVDLLFSPYGGGLEKAVQINRGGPDGGMRFEALTPASLWFDEGTPPVAVTPGFELSNRPGDVDLDGDIDLVTGGFSRARVWMSSLFDSTAESRDWVFALDRTNSMVGPTHDFFEPAKNVLTAFLNERQAPDQVGLVTFDYTGSDTGNPNAADDANKAQTNAQVGVRTFAEMINDVGLLTLGSCHGHCTAIGWALKTAKDVAVGAPDTTREKVIVLATDGNQNQGPEPDTILPSIPSNVLIYTVALGSGTDDRMLTALATNGGKFYYAGRSTDYASMQDTLRDIDADVEAQATGKQQLHPLRKWLWSPLIRETYAQAPLFKRQFGALIGPGGEFGPGPVDAFVVDPADRQVRFTLSWRQPSRTNRMIVTDPRGQTVSVTPGNPLIRDRRSGRSHVIEVLDPLSGVWRVQQQVSANTGPSKLTGMAASDLKLTVKPLWPLFYVDEPLLIDLAVREPQRAIAGLRGEARLLTPSKQELVLPLRAAQGGLRLETAKLTEPGTYRVELVAFGPAERPFVRSWVSAVHVATPTAEEPDLRTAKVTVDQVRLPADGTTTTQATLEIKRRDGAAWTGAPVSFTARGGQMTGAVTDLGGGRYGQTFLAGQVSGAGEIGARAGLMRLPARATLELTPGPVDAAASLLTVLVGQQRLCANQPGEHAVRAEPMDKFGNRLRGATVEIEASSGPSVRWMGPVEALGLGDGYVRRFERPRAGHYEFAAKVDGVTMGKTAGFDVFAADSAEGKLLDCASPVRGGGARDGFDGLPWWLWLLLLILVVVLVVWWLRS